MKEITIPYAPRKLQLQVHSSLTPPVRFTVLVCHRRFGKTVLCINELIKQALVCPREEGRYAYIAPFFIQAKDVAWTYLKRYTAVIPGVEFNESELRVDLPNGARIRLYGADNAERLRGLYLDGAVLDEYGQMNPNVWPEIIRPMLADRKGWAIFIGTPMGDNHFREIYDKSRLPSEHQDWMGPEWQGLMYKQSETGILDPAEVEAMRRAMSEDQFDRELECSFAASIPGAYYAKAIQRADDEGRIGFVRHDPLLVVHTAWDLGRDDDTAIWFIQQKGPQVRVIDHYASHGEHMDHYINICQERGQTKVGKGINHSGYNYGRFILPHDAKSQTLSAYNSPAQIVTKFGYRVHQLERSSNVQHGINLGRALIDTAWFDAEKCASGLRSLKHYQREYDEDRKVFREKPLHDWSSHDADAWRSAAEGLPATPWKADVPDKYRYQAKQLGPASWMSA